MLHLIVSGAGGGKTTEIMRLIGEKAQDRSGRIILLVPEQFTFTCEKTVLEKLGAEKAAGVDVLSFTALGENLLGSPALYERRRLSDPASAVLMSLALKTVKPSLRVYGKIADKPSAVKEFLSLSSEFKQNGVTPAKLGEVAADLGEGLLKAKLTDIAAVLGEYDSRVAGSFFDPRDLLTALIESEKISSHFAGSSVFIDSFRGFTGREYDVLERIIASAGDVYVALCADSAEDNDDITDIFAKTKNTASRIKALAAKAGVETECINLDKREKKYSRYLTPGLGALEEMMRSPTPVPYEDECPEITLCRAGDIFTECEFVAASIIKLVREEGFRFRDIAVIARDISAYEAPLHFTFKKYGVSTYEDTRKSVDVSPVITLISGALRAAADNFSNESVMRCLKTGLMGLGTRETSLLDNYCYTWQIKGKKWLSEWTEGTRGFSAISDDEQEEEAAKLAELNSLRRRVIIPIANLKKALSGGVKGSDAIEALWAFIKETGMRENTVKAASALNDDGESGSVIELRRVWDLLVATLDELHSLLADETVTASSLSALFDLMTASTSVGNIPQGLDEIIIGSPDRTRLSSPEAVFVIGANKGVFPAETKTVSSLTVKDRAKLESYGILLSDSAEWRLAEERLIAYCSLCAPRRKLFVSCSDRNAAGSELESGEFFAFIESMFPRCEILDADSLGGDFYSQANSPAFEQLAKSAPGEFRETLIKYFSSNEEFAGRLSSLQRAAGGRNFRIMNPETARRLFGERMFISPTKVEQYYKCAFSYFCKYGIKAAPRDSATLDLSSLGTVSHYVLENLFRENSRDALMGMSDGELRAKIKLYMITYLETVLKVKDDARFLYLYRKLEQAMFRVASRLIKEFSYSSFVPVDFELRIGSGQEIEPYYPGGTDGSVCIIGNVDRVDTAAKDGKIYLRVIDYKSRSKVKEFSLYETVHGINLQMLIYLFALWQNGKAKYGDNIVPAGVLYYRAAEPSVKADAGSTQEEIDALRKNQKALSGIILNSQDVIDLTDKDALPEHLPFTISKGIITGGGINIEALGALKRKMDKLIADMALHLRSGEIDALPKNTNYLACDYCDYKDVCGFEAGIPIVEIKKATDQAVIEDLLNEEAQEGGDEHGC